MKYSQEKIKEICEYVARGNTIEDSCALSDISKDTFYRWYREKSDFSDAIKKAKIKSKSEHINTIRKAGKKKWQASAWWLERNYPSEYSTGASETKENEENIIEEMIQKLEQENSPDGLENSINIATKVISNAMNVAPELVEKYPNIHQAINSVERD